MTAAAPDADLMATLRERTRPIHDRLEESELISGRLGTRAGVAELIARLHAFHEAYERRLDAYADLLDPLGFELAARRKLELLRADLRTLDAAAPPTPKAPAASAPDGAAAYVGRMYVAEGSTHGGVFIGREIARTLGFASRYYGCYGERTAARWRAFGEAVRRFDATYPSERAAVIAGAVAGFAEFERALT